MPISSGANNWPKTFWSRPPKRPGVHSRVIVVDRPDPPDLKGPSVLSSPQVTYRSPSPPPLSLERSSSPPRTPPIRRIVEERIHYNDPPLRDPPTPPPQITRTVTTRQFEPPPPAPPTQSRLYSRYRRFGRHNTPQGREPYGPGYDRYRYGYDYSQRGPNDSSCCGNHLFNSGRAGGDTGCCQGGLFSNKRYPYGAEDFYQMPGDGRHRCCACIWGLIAGLLLLGLLIGLLAGLMPALLKQNAQTAVSQQFTNGRYYNGIYYYQVTNPPDLFYLALGPGIPCNRFNNNSATRAPVTATVNTATVTGSAAPTTTRTTLPDCNRITTSFVQVQGISVSTTTVSWVQQFPNDAAKLSHFFSALPLLLVMVSTLLSSSYII